MGTPNIDPEKLTKDLAQIIGKPRYFHRLGAKTALDAAEEAVDAAFGSPAAPNLQYPVTAIEITPREYDFELYRAYDGVRAMTLKSWWCNRKALKRAVQAGTAKNGTLDHSATIRALLDLMYVHPSWNAGKEIARMGIPPGATTPAIVGLGNPAVLGGASSTSAANDPEVLQYFLPLFNDMWVVNVPHLSQNWPFSK